MVWRGVTLASLRGERERESGCAYHIKKWFRQITVQLCQAIRELGHIYGNQLIRVLYSIVEG